MRTQHIFHGHVGSHWLLERLQVNLRRKSVVFRAHTVCLKYIQITENFAKANYTKLQVKEKESMF